MPDPKTLLRVKNRTAALSVLRACDRAEAKNTIQVAKVHGSSFLVAPDQTYYLRKQYEPWLGKPRKGKSQTKTAVYQRNYRLRKKSQQTPSDDPLFLDACRAAGVKPYEKEASLIYFTLQFHKARLNGTSSNKRLPGIYSSMPQPDELEHEAPKLRELKQPPFGPKPKRNKTSPAQRPDPSLKYDANGLLELQQPVLDSSSFA